MYQYDEYDQKLVDERVAQFRDQTRRYLAGELPDDEYRMLRLRNWRGVYGAAGLTPAQRKELTDAVLAATRTRSWQDAVKTNAWSPSVITGDEFSKFVDDEHTRLRTVMTNVGLI